MIYDLINYFKFIHVLVLVHYLSDKRKKEPEDPWMAELLAIKRQRVEVEVRKAIALERIASALEFKKQ